MTQSHPDWFTGIASNTFNAVLKQYAGLPDQHFLQVGAWTGDASVWLMENVLTHKTSTLTDVDVWDLDIPPNYISPAGYNLTEIEKEYDQKVQPYGGRVIKVKSTSHSWLAQTHNKQYDFIYIDGDHAAKAVLVDALLAWDHLKVGGLMAFDDYLWEHQSDMNPGIGIDLFLKLYSEKLEIIKLYFNKADFVIIDYQLWLKKIST
jgi:predicted O-methyltransferase YrrM